MVDVRRGWTPKNSLVPVSLWLSMADSGGGLHVNRGLLPLEHESQTPHLSLPSPRRTPTKRVESGGSGPWNCCIRDVPGSTSRRGTRRLTRPARRRLRVLLGQIHHGHSRIRGRPLIATTDRTIGGMSGRILSTVHRPDNPQEEACRASP